MVEARGCKAINMASEVKTHRSWSWCSWRGWNVEGWWRRSTHLSPKTLHIECYLPVVRLYLSDLVIPLRNLGLKD